MKIRFQTRKSYYGENAYAVPSKGEKFWTVTKVRHDKSLLNAGEVCMKGKVTNSYNNRMWVTWDIESYFVPEGKGRDIEQDIRDVSVKASIDSTCRAIIKELYINDKPVRFGE